MISVAAVLLTECQGGEQSSDDSASSNTSGASAAQSSDSNSQEMAGTPARNPHAVDAPEFTLPDLQGTPISLSQYRGHVVLLDFWATWCGPCRQTIPDLKYLYETHRNEGLDILGVALERQGLQNLTTFVEQNKIPYTVLVGDASVVSSYGNIRSIPTTFLIGRDGTIRNRMIGVQPRAVLEQAITALLAEPPA